MVNRKQPEPEPELVISAPPGEKISAPQHQCCWSGMFIPDPGSRFCTNPVSRTQKTATKEARKILVVIPFFVAPTNFSKLKIILLLNCWRTKFGPVFKELYNFLSNQTRGQKGTGPRIRIRNIAQHWLCLWADLSPGPTARTVASSPFFCPCSGIRIPPFDFVSAATRWNNEIRNFCGRL